MTESIRPFRIETTDDQLEDLKRRLVYTRFPEKETVGDWSQGTPLSYMQEVCEYWATEYDWRATEARLNAQPQFLTEIDGVDIHFFHHRSKESQARPLARFRRS